MLNLKFALFSTHGAERISSNENVIGLYPRMKMKFIHLRKNLVYILLQIRLKFDQGFLIYNIKRK
jgi:hypothetical protein